MHTKKKVFHNYKIKKKIGRAWIKLQTKLPWNNSNINLDLLNEKPVKSFLRRKLKPPNYFKSMDLKRVLYSDIVFIEHYEGLRKGLHKLFSNEKPLPFGHFRQHDIDNFFENVFNFPNGRLHSKMFSFVPEEKEMLYFFESLHIYLSSLTNSYITVSINAVISEDFKGKLNQLYKDEIDYGHIVLTPPYRLIDFFKIKKWLKINYSEVNYKKSNIEDYFLEMKSLLASYLNRELPLYFSDKYKMVPSLSLFETKLYGNPVNRSHFFESIGFTLDDPLKHINTNGNIEVYENDVDEIFQNININIIYNNINILSKEAYIPLEPHILAHSLYQNLLQLISLEFLLTNISKESVLLIKEFNEINEKKLQLKTCKYRKLTKTKVIVDQLIFRLKELNKDVDKALVSRLYESYLHSIQLNKKEDNEKNIIKLKYTNLTDKINSSLFRIEYLKNSIDDSLDLLNTRINKNHQIWMFLIGCATLIITLITLLKTK